MAPQNGLTRLFCGATFIAVLFMTGLTLFQNIMNSYVFSNNLHNYGDWVISSVGRPLSHPYLMTESKVVTGLTLVDEDGAPNRLFAGKVDENFTRLYDEILYEGRMPEADKAKGSVELACVQGADYIKITIRDHGPGLSTKDIPNIFDRFYLPENVKENHTGIGLNLAKLVIEGHQGSVYVYNHGEGGAVFQIILPIYESLKVRG